ncbi:hypothetical protein LTR36_007214 [Oleoguttula mirabilis]|uniref:Rhodopsin domain-containing protein n=1 Tax=Oleoguttula mirabilis TaxID=1507867 RepID=A0AAV9JB33_9PEZI|nr:hypothetical protein LTR36_007214 [Oleoguttula mirabilis]
MALWSSAPPEPRDRYQNNPTLLFSWWCTIFSAVIIITRLCGRKVRSNVLFREDWIMMLSLIPLLIRMGFVHVILLYGTNNIETVGYHFTDTQLQERSTGSRLVLAARIFYAAFIWSSKLTISEFLKRITIRIWRKSYEITLQGIRIFLLVTFIAVVIATLTECQPFSTYWQVVPDPGPRCRQGYAQLITMGVCDIITDILLVVFPIPIVFSSGQTWKRKLQLTSLFSLSLIMIGVTATRVPEVISHHGRQQYRTVWASCEILASTAVSNGVILGSFLRDKGTKKNKYRSHSVTDSIDAASVRRPTMTALQQLGSDEDLFRFLGCRMPEHLKDETDAGPRRAPPAPPASVTTRRGSKRMPALAQLEMEELDGADSLRKHRIAQPPLPSPAPSTKPSVSFFDVGGLLENGSLNSRSRSTLLDSGASGTLAQDFAPPSPQQSRRGSHAFLADMGGIMPPVSNRNGSGNGNSSGYGQARRHSDAQQTFPPRQGRNAPIGVLGPMLERHETQQSLQDAGGLLASQRASVQSQHSTSPTSNHFAGKSPGIERQNTEQRLQNVGGLLSNARAPDASAAALRRVSERGEETALPTSQSSPDHRHHRGPDEMSLHDPGGLLS